MSKRQFLLLILTLAVILTARLGPASAGPTEPGARWTRRKASEGRLFGIAWSGRQFVAVGERTVLTSPDGLSWKQQAARPVGNFQAAAWGKSLFVAVGSRSGPRGPVIVTSPDGVAWTQRDAPGSEALTDVASSGDRFVALGFSTILTSTDGVTWTSQSTSVDGGFQSVTWAGSQFVIVGGRPSGAPAGPPPSDEAALKEYLKHYQAPSWTAVILTSPDGATWTQRAAPGSNTLEDVAWSGDRFVAVGRDTILTSTDAVTWSEQRPPVGGQLIGVAWGGSLFVVVGRTQDPSSPMVTIPLILTSSDGITWSQKTTSTDGSLWEIVWGGARFVAVGQIRSKVYYDALVVTSP